MSSIFVIIVSIIAGLGAGIGTGIAGMSAAVVIAPMLITLCDMPAYQAVTISLTADVVASAVSAYTYGKSGHLDIKDGLVMMVSVMVFTAIGSWLASYLPDIVLGSASYLLTIIMGIRFLVSPVTKTTSTMQQLDTKQRVTRSILAGIPIGLICGIVGAGGGMMMLLILTTALGYPLKTAVGTSTFIMAFTAATGGISHMIIGGMPDLTALIVCAIAAPIGARLTSLFANKVDEKTLNRATGAVLLALGIVMAVVSIF